MNIIIGHERDIVEERENGGGESRTSSERWKRNIPKKNDERKKIHDDPLRRETRIIPKDEERQILHARRSEDEKEKAYKEMEKI